MSQKPIASTKDITKVKTADPEKVKEVCIWMKSLLPDREFNVDTFFDDIKDGVPLCELVNVIKPGTCKKFKKLKIEVKQYFHKIDVVSSFKQELIFAIPQVLASMEEHVSMHWTRLFVTVRCDTRENIVEMTSASVVTSTQTA